MFEYPQQHRSIAALQRHSKLISTIFFGVLALCGAGAYLTLQYSATAVVALNPAAADQQRSPVELAWSLLPDKQIQAIIDQFQLNSGLTKLLARGRTFTYIRSNIFVHQLNSAQNAPQQVALTFFGFNRSTVIGVSDALAQNVAFPGNLQQQGSSAEAAASLDAEIQKSRKTLQLLSAGENTDTVKTEIQRRFQTDSDLKEDEQDIEYKMVQLNQRQAAAELAARNRVAPHRKSIPNPAKIALQQQISSAESRLAELRDRYTDQYPDVVDAKNSLAALEERLSRMAPDKLEPAPEKPGLSPQQQASFAMQRAAIEDAQAEMEQKIQNNQHLAEPLRQRIADGKSFAQDYTVELAHYNALLKTAQAGSSSLQGGAPLFTVVQGATATEPQGIAFNPVFWIESAGGALLLAVIAAYVAELFAPSEEERTAAGRQRTI